MKISHPKSRKSFKKLGFAIGLAAIVLLQPVSAQSFFESLLKNAAEAAAKQALEKNGIAAPQGATDAAALAAQQQALQQQQAQQQQAQAAAIADPGCKRGQLINPYYVMLQANLLPDASLADAPCVSTTQLQSLHGKYAKLTVK
jgi:hypothetical protein